MLHPSVLVRILQRRFRDDDFRSGEASARRGRRPPPPAQQDPRPRAQRQPPSLHRAHKVCSDYLKAAGVSVPEFSRLKAYRAKVVPARQAA